MRAARGSLFLPLGMVLAIVCVAGAGIWGLLRHWKGLAQTQLRLDECVAEVALELRETLEEVEAANTRIRALRASVAVALVSSPEAVAPLQIALRAQVLAQEGIRTRWRLKTLTWWARQGCVSRSDRPHPLPEPGWIRDPEDPLGPQPLRWIEGDSPHEFFIQLDHPPRRARARLHLAQESVTWRAEWAAPGPGFP